METSYINSFKSWTREFLMLKCLPMGLDMTDAFMTCCVSEAAPDFPPERLKASLPYQIAIKRFEALGVNVAPAVVAFIACMCSNPAQIVMFVMAIKGAYVIGRVQGGGTFNIGNLAHLWPNGFPSEAQLREAWEKQKLDKAVSMIDNMLDVVMGELVPQGG